MITAQTAALSNERAAIGILGSRMVDTVLLIEALGGGWNAGDLPSADALAVSTEARARAFDTVRGSTGRGG